MGFAGQVYVSSSSSIYGPWSIPEQVQFLNSTEMLRGGGYTNPSPHFDADGTIYLAFQSQPKHVPSYHLGGAMTGIAKGTNLAGPFSYLTTTPVTPDKFWCIGGQ